MSTDQESTPAQNETDEQKTDDTKTLKPESETTFKNSPPSQTTATNKPETDEAKALKQIAESDPNHRDIPQAGTQTSSRNSSLRDAPTPTNNSITEDAEALKEGTADPRMLEKTPSEDQTTSKSTSTTKNDSETTKEQEIDGTQPDSAAVADPPVQEITAAEYETAQSRAVKTPEGDDTVAREMDSTTDADPQVRPVKNESTSIDSSPPSQAAATQEPETDEGEKMAEELVDPHPPVQEISPADDETTPKELSPPINDSGAGINDPETGAAEALKEDSTNDTEPSPKKISQWKKLRNLLFLLKGKVPKPKSSAVSQDSKDEATARRLDEKQLVSLIQADIDYITKRAKELGHYNDELSSILVEASKYFKVLKEQGKMEGLRELRKDMMKLKLQDPSKYKFDADEKDPLKNLRFRSKAKQGISQEVLDMMPQLHNSHVFETSMEFKDFEARYNELCPHLKLCLLCFSVFPESTIIRKRLMVQWWVAEGFASEKKANEHFNLLIKKGFIEPVNKNRSLSLGSCRMHPFYRSALVMLAERAKFWNFGAKGEPTQNFSGSFQACLVGEGLISFEDLKEKRLTVDDLEKLHLLINVDEHILEFKPEWFSKMTNLNFLYLGRWKVLATDHIEVEDTKFLSGLENMSCVKFLSLQGISNIIALPKSILQLANLKILDLRACYNLETIPQRIEFLKNLTHLDMSECYLVDHMPKSLSSLRELRVIKGFVVGNDEGINTPCCTLDDLEILPNLIKLCIYTGLMKFPEEKHVTALEKLKELCKLTITWGGSALRAVIDNQSNNGNEKDNSTAENKKPKKQKPQGRLPPKLEKLDLECFPMPTTPYWLELNHLKDLNLKKLYIRGGKLSDLGQYQDIDDCNLVQPVKKETWKVEVLRLKYLSEIEMEWRQLQELFPRLVYLEQVSCPKLTLFPCDANGVWINKAKSKASNGIS